MFREMEKEKSVPVWICQDENRVLENCKYREESYFALVNWFCVVVTIRFA